MSRFSIRIQSNTRFTLRTDRGRQGETGPAGYAIPIDGMTILANPLNSEASPIAIPAEEARSLIGAISAPDMQAAVDPIISAVDDLESGKSDVGHSHSNATTSAAGFMSSADKTKLNGVATGATANSTDATLLARANHTGTQAIGTITSLETTLDGKASTSHTHAVATTSVDGFMSAADKVTLSAIRDSLAPKITIQPTTSEVYEGQIATYTVTATTLIGALTYQWQYSADGVAWTNFSSATAASYTTATLQAAFDGFHVSCLVGNGVTTTRTNSVQQSVWSPLKLGSKLVAWFDPTQRTYVERTSATTLAAVGDPVGRWVSRADANVYMNSNADTRRPVRTALRLSFDGVDDYFAEQSAGLRSLHAGKGCVWVWVQVRAPAGSGRYYIAQMSGASVANSLIALQIGRESALVSYRLNEADTATGVAHSYTGVADNDVMLFGFGLDAVSGKLRVRRNGVETEYPGPTGLFQAATSARFSCFTNLAFTAGVSWPRQVGPLLLINDTLEPSDIALIESYYTNIA